MTTFILSQVPLNSGNANENLAIRKGSLIPSNSTGGGGKLVQAGPLGTGAAAWAASWSSGGSLVAPYACALSSALQAASAPPAADATEVRAIWSDGPAGLSLANVGVYGYSPPTGQGATLLQAIDAAVLAAAVLHGAQVLADADGAIRQLLAATWILWVNAGGSTLRGGGGGLLRTLTLSLG